MISSRISSPSKLGIVDLARLRKCSLPVGEYDHACQQLLKSGSNDPLTTIGEEPSTTTYDGESG